MPTLQEQIEQAVEEEVQRRVGVELRGMGRPRVMALPEGEENPTLRQVLEYNGIDASGQILNGNGDQISDNTPVNAGDTVYQSKNLSNG